MAKNLTSPKGKLVDGGKFSLTFGLVEAAVDRGQDATGQPKREIVITALQEGPGNARDRRFYTREAVQNAEAVFYARKKLFTNHLKETQTPCDEDLRNWCATLKETWTEEVDGRLHRKVRLKIHEDWLWTRCLEAPEEIALSIEGSGAGKEGVREGQPYMVIEKIWTLNATKFVTYPGNAKMGADLVESAAATTEESPMDLKDLTAAMLKEGRADLVSALAEEQVAPLKKALAEAQDKLAQVQAQAPQHEAKIVEQIAALKTSLNATIDELRNKLVETEKKLDAAEIRERMLAKKDLIEKKLAESGLAAEAKTPRFVERLYGLTERKVKDASGQEKVLTLGEQVDAEIAEQHRLVTADFGSIRTEKGIEKKAAAATGDGNLTEEERQVVFNREFFHTGPTLEEFRAAKAKEKAATA